MKEILFRGKRTDNGEWVYGYPLIDTAPCSLKAQGKCVCAHDGSSAIIYYWNDGFHEYEGVDVIPGSIGQFTGLTDKHGIKIFEGDIVRFQLDNDDCPFPNRDTTKRIGRIFFSDFRASFAIAMGRNGSSSINNDLYKYAQNGNRVEVIGNIHNNPELLKEDDNE